MGYLDRYTDTAIRYKTNVEIFKERITSLLREEIRNELLFQEYDLQFLQVNEKTSWYNLIFSLEKDETFIGVKLTFGLARWKTEGRIFTQFINTKIDVGQDEGSVVSNVDFELAITTALTEDEFKDFIHEMWKTIRSYIPYS